MSRGPGSARSVDFSGHEEESPEDWLGVTIDGKYIIEGVLAGGIIMVFSARRTLIGDELP